MKKINALSISGLFIVVLALLACANKAVALPFDFSSGIDSAYWTETQTQSGLYTVTTDVSGVTFAKTGTTLGGFQYVGLQLDLTKVTTTGNITGDFSVSVDFSNASVDDGGSLNQIQLNLFTSGGVSRPCAIPHTAATCTSGSAHIFQDT
jgi:hypothetical protein